VIERGQDMEGDERQQRIVGQKSVHVAGQPQPGARLAINFGSSSPNMTTRMPLQLALSRRRTGTTNSSPL